MLIVKFTFPFAALGTAVVFSDAPWTVALAAASGWILYSNSIRIAHLRKQQQLRSWMDERVGGADGLTHWGGRYAAPLTETARRRDACQRIE